MMSRVSGHRLSSWRLKLKRATEHFDVLDEDIGRFLKHKTYDIRVTFEPQTQYYIARMRVLVEPDPRWSVTLGDMLHNLRCSLDHILFEDATREMWRTESREMTEGEAKNVQFPIKLGQFNATKKFLSEPMLTLLEQLAPYKRGEMAEWTPLGAIEWLSNRDKHRALHPAYLSLGSSERASVELDPVPDLGAITDYEPGIAQGETFKDRTEFARFRFERTDPEAKVNVNHTLPTDICFVDGPRSIRLLNLHHLYEMVVAAVNLMEDALRCGTE
jgi:hypothetical protein